MNRQQHTFTEEELALPPGQWVIGKDRVLHYQKTPTHDWIPHDTDAGYYRHLYYNIPPCDGCKTAHAEVAAKRTGGKKQQTAQCGTTSGYKRHRITLNEEACDDCKAANRNYNRNNHQARLNKAAEYGVPVAGQTTCAECSTIIDKRSTRCRPCFINERKATAKPTAKHTHEVDEMLVRRVINGEWKLKTTPAEKTAVCALWVAQGGSLRQLSKITGWRTERYYRATDTADKAA